jgi:hypothetical protein
MTSEEKTNKLTAYFGFALRKKSIFVGMKLEEALARKRVALLLILPECSKKNEEKLKFHASVNPDCRVLRVDESFSVKAILGFERLKALGIKDQHLAKAIYETYTK